MIKARKIPHTYVIVFSLIIFSAILTWFVPGGEYQRETRLVNGIEREVIRNQTFSYTESQAQTWQVFAALYEGFTDKADIIVFILIIGGAFWIMNDSKAIDAGIQSFLRRTTRMEKVKIIRRVGVNNLVIVLIMLVFSFFGATFGMSEETIAFVIIFVPLAIGMGYDSITGVSICFVAAGLGFAGALLNPFTIGIAQGLSGLPLFSGIEYRLFCWIVINLIGIAWVLWYASRVKRNPGKSPVYSEDDYWRRKQVTASGPIVYHTPRKSWFVYGAVAAVLLYYSFSEPLTILSIGNSTLEFPAFPFITAVFLITGYFSLRKSAHFFILSLLMITILLLVTGVMGYQWYIMEIATLFFAMGIAAGLANGKSAGEITGLFLEGVKDILSAAMVVGLAGGILFILQNGQVIDTLLFYISRSMDHFGKLASVQMMYVFTTLINLLIPSGSAKAALLMPIMSQFSDLIEVSRQATVMAFQLGDGFTNMITPTSGVLLGVIGAARIPYEKWLKWVIPFMIILVLLGALLLIPTVYLELNGF